MVADAAVEDEAVVAAEVDAAVEVSSLGTHSEPDDCFKLVVNNFHPGHGRGGGGRGRGGQGNDTKSSENAATDSNLNEQVANLTISDEGKQNQPKNEDKKNKNSNSGRGGRGQGGGRGGRGKGGGEKKGGGGGDSKGPNESGKGGKGKGNQKGKGGGEKGDDPKGPNETGNQKGGNDKGNKQGNKHNTNDNQKGGKNEGKGDGDDKVGNNKKVGVKANNKGKKESPQTQNKDRGKETKGQDKTVNNNKGGGKNAGGGGGGGKNKKSSDKSIPTGKSATPPNKPQQTSDINYGNGQNITVFHVAEKPSIAQVNADKFNRYRFHFGLRIPLIDFLKLFRLSCRQLQRDFAKETVLSEKKQCQFMNSQTLLSRKLLTQKRLPIKLARLPDMYSLSIFHNNISRGSRSILPNFFGKNTGGDNFHMTTETICRSHVLHIFHSAPIVRKPCKGSVVKYLQDESKGADFIVLWMDCDRYVILKFACTLDACTMLLFRFFLDYVGKARILISKFLIAVCI